MKKKDNVSEKLVEYIKQNNISIEQISKDTGVSGFKLSKTDVVFTASECSYLNVSPESFK